ncbi:MAG: V-type ATP synthase subunit D [Patescibacteria group bacterium]|nr:V-type ATP synthase subunit D [Patescibacteria group bacterium]
MAILNVSPTRSELQTIKARTKQAARGHKLLKDKQDGLMKAFMDIVKEARTRRAELEGNLSEAFSKLIFAGASTNPNMIENALLANTAELSLGVDTKSVMSVNIPQFSVKQSGDMASYGFLQTPADLDTALTTFNDLVADLVRLAEVEKTAESLAEELEKTRRRVNTLEHRVLPDLKDTVKFIKLKLDEAERAQIIAVMKVKEMQEAQEAEAEAAVK